MKREIAHLRNLRDAEHRGTEARERGEEERHLVIEPVHDEQPGERNQRQSAVELGPAPGLRRRGQRVVDPLLGPHGTLVVAHRVEHIVAVERRRQFLADVVTEQQLARFPGQICVDERAPERCALLHPLDDLRRLAFEILCVELDQLDGRQDFPMPRCLEKSDVFGVGINDVHRVEVDPPPFEILAKVPGHDEIGNERIGPQ
jgi:hypothetical protein